MSYYSEKGVKRFFNAILFSLAGLNAAWKNEEAFRLEVIAFVLALPLSIWLSATNIEALLLMSTIILVMVAELLNSAIEAVVDRISDEYHELSGRAKDLGSAAVMLTIILALVTWTLILF